MAATSEQRRAAVVRRLKAEGPQPRPVFRSGVDIDAIHFRLGAVTTSADTLRPAAACADDAGVVGAVEHAAALPRSRSAAIEAGSVRYFTGDPCPAGHLAARYTLGGYCVVCQRAATRANRRAAKDRRHPA